VGDLIYLVLARGAPGLGPTPDGVIKHVRPELVEEEDIVSLGHLDDGELGREAGHKRLFTLADPDDGWQISNGVINYPHYYLVEWRNDAGVDHNLAIGTCDVQDWGMLVWYINDQKYTANEIYVNLEDPPSFGPKGKALVVDAHP